MIVRVMVAAMVGIATASPATGQTSSTPVTVHGIAYDSLHGAALSGAFIVIAGTSRSTTSDANGRFVFDSVVPGTYRFIMQHDMLDSIGVSGTLARAAITDGRDTVRVAVPSFTTLWRGACHTPTPPADSGFVFGRVEDSSGTRSAGVVISATWIGSGVDGAGRTGGAARLETTADSAGNFALCGVPTTTGISLHALIASVAMAPVGLPPLNRTRIGHRDLVLDQSVPVASGATFSGRVLTDTTHLPIANADVSLPELGISGVTGEKGEFRLSGIVSGSHQVLVRRIGYALLDTRLDFAESQVVVRTVYLERITLLDSVNVAAPAHRDVGLEDFAENRARGFGSFLTRAELAKMEGRTFGSIMAQMQGLGIVYGAHGQAWVQGKHAPMTHCRNTSSKDPVALEQARQCFRQEGFYYLPDAREKAEGMLVACYATVYQDRMPMNSTRDPFDLNSVRTDQVEAIEWYADWAQTPPQYTAQRSVCGVLVIHTRRSP